MITRAFYLMILGTVFTVEAADVSVKDNAIKYSHAREGNRSEDGDKLNECVTKINAHRERERIGDSTTRSLLSLSKK